LCQGLFKKYLFGDGTAHDLSEQKVMYNFEKGDA
jgi:hypothetical protein